jgi:hypothetical protein
MYINTYIHTYIHTYASMHDRNVSVFVCMYCFFPPRLDPGFPLVRTSYIHT